MVARGWTIEYMSLKDIREKQEPWLHPKHLVNWCLGGDFHVLLCQGIHNGMFGIWKPVDCQREVLRLQMHPGFPTGLQVHCPVLSADKFEYLCAAKDICLPTFKIPLTHDEVKLDEILASLQNFLLNYGSFDGPDSGFIIKAPFVQNQRGFKMNYFKTFDEIIRILKRVYTKKNNFIDKLYVYTTEVFPYLIVQPRMRRSNESKVILFNGKAQYVVTTVTGISRKSFAQETLMEFAEKAWKILVDRCRGAFLSDGLVRVDLFCTSNGQLVVNEFESLDAAFFGPNIKELQTGQFLTSYYADMLNAALPTIL